MSLVRVALATTIVVLLAAGCGGPSKQHRAVADYVDSVNAVETGLAVPLRAVSTANAKFAKSQSDPKVLRSLAQAVKTMQSFERQLAALAPPPEALHLHALLMRLVQREVALSKEVEELASFVPRFSSAVQPLGAADASLKTALGRTAKGSAAASALDREKADALDAYASAVSDAIASLSVLHPPPVWAPAYDGQLQTLRALRTTATALATAIRQKRAAAVPVLLRRFDAAAVANQSTAMQHRRIAAIAAYDRRVRSLTTLAQAVAKERDRLQRRYG